MFASFDFMAIVFFLYQQGWGHRWQTHPELCRGAPRSKPPLSLQYLDSVESNWWICVPCTADSACSWHYPWFLETEIRHRQQTLCRGSSQSLGAMWRTRIFQQSVRWKGSIPVYGGSFSEGSRAAYKLPLIQLNSVTAGWLEPLREEKVRERERKREKYAVKRCFISSFCSLSRILHFQNSMYR